jgi:PAS domain S-box-containing protein
MRRRKVIKEEAVARMRDSTVPVLELAREYGVSTNTLRAWLRDSQLRSRAQEDAQRVATSLSQEECTAVSQRERLLMHALEYSPATIIITDAEGRIVYTNPKFAATTGYAVDEAIGKNPRILKSGETTPDEYRQLWKTILGGKEWRGTFHNRCKDGHLYWERASISPVLNEEGKITHFMAVKEDITEFMENEIASRRAAAAFRLIFDALPCAIVLIDQQMVIRFSNSAAEQLMGTALPVGTEFNQLNLRWINSEGIAFTSADHPLIQMLSATAAVQDKPVRMGIVPPMGGVRWVQASLRAVTLPETDIAAALITLSADEGVAAT